MKNTEVEKNPKSAEEELAETHQSLNEWCQMMNIEPDQKSSVRDRIHNIVVKLLMDLAVCQAQARQQPVPSKMTDVQTRLVEVQREAAALSSKYKALLGCLSLWMEASAADIPAQERAERVLKASNATMNIHLRVEAPSSN